MRTFCDGEVHAHEYEVIRHCYPLQIGEEHISASSSVPRIDVTYADHGENGAKADGTCGMRPRGYRKENERHIPRYGSVLQSVNDQCVKDLIETAGKR